MSHTIQPDIAQQIIAATQKLAIAQTELEGAMAELTVAAEHADTTYVTERLRKAFTEVAAAKAALASIVGLPI